MPDHGQDLCTQGNFSIGRNGVSSVACQEWLNPALQMLPASLGCVNFHTHSLRGLCWDCQRDANYHQPRWSLGEVCWDWETTKLLELHCNQGLNWWVLLPLCSFLPLAAWGQLSQAVLVLFRWWFCDPLVASQPILSNTGANFKSSVKPSAS